MALTVRDAAPGDVTSIEALARGEAAFRVSDAIRFYETRELCEWIARPEDNVLLVAEVDGRVVGFCYCKIMSYHWAMLDNFYVRRDPLAAGAGRALFEALGARLSARRVEYLSTLVAEDRPSLSRLMRPCGFRQAGGYRWHECFLAERDA